VPTDGTGVRNGRQKVLLLGRAGDAHGPLCARLLALLAAFVARFLPGLHCYILVVLQELSIFRPKLQGSISGNMLPSRMVVLNAVMIQNSIRIIYCV